jgi:hypothetical protein
MTVRKLLFRGTSLVVALVVGTATTSFGITNGGRVDHATTYVVNRQRADGSFPSSFGTAHASTADAVVSMVASGQGGAEVDAAIEWLEDNVGGADTVGKKAKIVLAAVAAGRDPRNFGGQNLVADLEGTLGGDDVYDSSPFSQVFDQALVLLALKGAGAPISRGPVKWLADAQCPVGGWQFDQPRQPGENGRCRDVDDDTDFTEADTNTTGIVLQALAAVPRSVSLKGRPFRWLGERRDRVKGGWGFDRTFSLTDSLSTSIVLQAFAAHHKKQSREARKALRELQRYCTGNKQNGGFSRGWERHEGAIRRVPGTDYGNTVGAILGLLQRPLPIAPRPHLEPMPEALPCDPVS